MTDKVNSLSFLCKIKDLALHFFFKAVLTGRLNLGKTMTISRQKKIVMYFCRYSILQEKA